MCFGTSWSPVIRIIATSARSWHFQIHFSHQTIWPRVWVVRRGGRGGVAIGSEGSWGARHAIHIPTGGWYSETFCGNCWLIRYSPRENGMVYIAMVTTLGWDKQTKHTGLDGEKRKKGKPILVWHATHMDNFWRKYIRDCVNSILIIALKTILAEV